MNPMNARYTHTNLIARDWRKLADFYQELFGCTPVPPERDYTGDLIEAGTGISGVHVCGMHLRLPGFGENGPTLEIFNYEPLKDMEPPTVNQPGFGHLAFCVDNVNSAQKSVLEAGGKPVGEIVTVQIATGAKVTWCYVTDPEGNIIELQSWTA